MKQLLLIAVCIFLVSCSGDRTKNADKHISMVLEEKQDKKILLNDIWIATSIGGTAININPETDGIEAPMMEIKLADMQYTGTDGCNRFMGGITELDEESIHFGIATGTRKMCMDMMIPDQFNKALPLVASYKQEDLILTLFNEEGEELIQFKKVD